MKRRSRWNAHTTRALRAAQRGEAPRGSGGTRRENCSSRGPARGTCSSQRRARGPSARTSRDRRKRALENTAARARGHSHHPSSVQRGTAAHCRGRQNSTPPSTYRLKCSRIRSSRILSGKFPTHRCLVSLTILHCWPHQDIIALDSYTRPHQTYIIHRVFSSRPTLHAGILRREE